MGAFAKQCFTILLLLVNPFIFSACGWSSSELSREERSELNNTATLLSRDATLEECPHGGVVFEHGIDSNGNGQLEPTEVSTQHIVCNGADGQDGATGANGQNGINSLINLADATTDECPNGGTRIEVGLDNGDGEGIAYDGVLHADEIDSITLMCNDGGEERTLHNCYSATYSPLGDTCDFVDSTWELYENVTLQKCFEWCEQDTSQYACNHYKSIDYNFSTAQCLTDASCQPVVMGYTSIQFDPTSGNNFECLSAPND